MIKYTQTHQAGSDCTAPYDIAVGGWSNMDYSITSAEDVTEVVMYCKLHNDEHTATVAAAGLQLAEK